jgi:hypothetical protein
MHGDGTHARMVCSARRTIQGEVGAPVYTGTLSSKGSESSGHDTGRLEAQQGGSEKFSMEIQNEVAFVGGFKGVGGLG